MADVNIGVDNQAIDNLVLNIYDYADRLKKQLDDVETLVYDTSNYYHDQAADSCRKKFNSIKESFPVIYENVISYADDLVKLKSSLKQKDEAISVEITNASKNLENLGGE